MGCLRFLLIIARTFSVSMIGSGVIWIVQGLFEQAWREPFDIGNPLGGGLALIVVGFVSILPTMGLQEFVKRLDAKRPVVQVSFQSSDFIERMDTLFTAFDFMVERSKKLGISTADLFAQKKQWLFFIPGSDWHYLFVLEDGRKLSTGDVLGINAEAKAFSNKHFKLPAWLRLHVPMTATSLISPTGFSEEVVALVKKTKFSRGGDMNDIFLIDLAREQILHSENRPASGYVPLDRVYETLVKFADLAKA